MAGMDSFEMQVAANIDRLISEAGEVKKITPEKTLDTVKTAKKGFSDNKAHEESPSPRVSVRNTEDTVNRRKNVTSGKTTGVYPRIISLASGSRANCTLVDGGDTRILIDFGLSCRMLSDFLKRYGLEISDIDAVFVTHEHIDHVYGLPTFFKKYDIPVHMTEPSYLAYTRKAGFEHRNRITVHQVEYSAEIGGFTVSSCEVCHDSAACVSYLVEGYGTSFCTCTDLGFMPQRVFEHVSRAENVILESNHDVTLLETGAYPDELKRRIRSRFGHLSNDQCDGALPRLVEAGVKRILLGHISPENNEAQLALKSAKAALGDTLGMVEYLAVAPRLEPIVLLGDGGSKTR